MAGNPHFPFCVVTAHQLAQSNGYNHRNHQSTSNLEFFFNFSPSLSHNQTLPRIARFQILWRDLPSHTHLPRKRSPMLPVRPRKRSKSTSRSMKRKTRRSSRRWRAPPVPMTMKSPAKIRRTLMKIPRPMMIRSKSPLSLTMSFVLRYSFCFVLGFILHCFFAHA